MGEGKAKAVIGNLFIICSIYFSGFAPKKLFHAISDNLNGFQNFDGLPNALNRRYRVQQNKLTLAEVFLEFSSFILQVLYVLQYITSKR